MNISLKLELIDFLCLINPSISSHQNCIDLHFLHTNNINIQTNICLIYKYRHRINVQITLIYKQIYVKFTNIDIELCVYVCVHIWNGKVCLCAWDSVVSIHWNTSTDTQISMHRPLIPFIFYFPKARAHLSLNILHTRITLIWPLIPLFSYLILKVGITVNIVSCFVFLFYMTTYTVGVMYLLTIQLRSEKQIYIFNNNRENQPPIVIIMLEFNHL